MFEFWYDLLNDKETFLFTVLIPTFVVLVFYVISKMLKNEDIDELKSDVSELKRYVYNGKGKEKERE